MNKYEELTALVTVVDQGSFSAAAERMSLAKSAISRRVSELEKRLGVRLLNRTTRRLSLTNAGRSLYERATQILMDWDEAEQMVSSESASLSGRLRIATPLTFGIRHLGSVVADFAKEHPDVRLDVDLNDREVDLVEEGFDMAIRIGKLADSTLVARRITDIDLWCVASPNYLLAHGIPQTPVDLDQHVSLRYSLGERSALWRFKDSNGREHKARPQEVLSANNGDYLADMAKAGLGIVVLPAFIVHEAVEQGTLVPILKNYQVGQVTMYVVFPPGRYLSRRVRVFADAMTAAFADRRSWSAVCAF